ncbi:MAG: helix-turn-helix transcriptional regulator [Methyloceanibacter sp.]
MHTFHGIERHGRGFYSTRQVCELTTYSKTTLWREVRAERFPPPIKISPGRVAYIREQVNAWIQAKVTGGERGDG